MSPAGAATARNGDHALTTRNRKGFQMADDTSATIHLLHQPKPKTGAERARAYRARKAGGPVTPPAPSPVTPPSRATPPVTSRPVTSRVTTVTSLDVTPAAVTSPTVTPSRVTPSWRHSGWTLPPPPAFANLERSTAGLVAACQKGMEATRQVFGGSNPAEKR
jgi:hypothetical protein